MPNLNAIPGLTALQSLTLGDPRITIAILDGRADLERACFAGANLTQVLPFWQENVEIVPQDLEKYLAIANAPPNGSSSTATQQLAAAFPDPVRLNRIHLACHATHICSILLGQPQSPVQGIAPHCTGINIPLDVTGRDGELIAPLTLARAFNLAQVKRAHLMHCAACQPTPTGTTDPLLQRTIAQIQTQNVLIVAPGGNDRGECWCIPAALPGVLAVGAMTDTGQPFEFSNWGGAYQTQGILAPGEHILGAQPATDIPIQHQGTSCAAPIVTGVAALLLSLQLQAGQRPDPKAVQAAILDSAIPCNPQETPRSDQCLRGKLNIQGAWQRLFDPPSQQFAAVLPRPTAATNTPTAASSGSSPPRATAEPSPATPTQVDRQAAPEPPQLQKLRQFYNDIGQRLGAEGRTYQACFLRQADPNLALDQATNLFAAAQANIQPDDYILDAACGAGGPSIDIAQHYPRVRIAGINLSETQVAIAKQLIQTAGLQERVQIQVGDYHALPYGDQVFDKVLCLEASGYATHLAQVFAEFFRVLKPGGTLYLKEWLRPHRPLTPDEAQQLTTQEQLALYQTRSAHTLQSLLATAGFTAITIRDLSGILAPEPDWPAPIACGDIKAQRPPRLLGATPAVPAAMAAPRPSLMPSISPLQRVYALGTLGYDFGNEARRDSFKQLMPIVHVNDLSLPANPYDAHQMVDYLGQHLSEAHALIWTLNLELTPIYAIQPTGPFAREIYGRMQQILAGQITQPSDEHWIERVSVPGYLTPHKIKLFSGQIVPVVEVEHLRGFYGWQVNQLIEDALNIIQPSVRETVAATLTAFLHRVYYDFHNLGQQSCDRALNFAVTNAFQAASTFATAVGQGLHLDHIAVEKSPFCRLHSDCWDVKLQFFDPENCDRARRVFRFTIDVSDVMPVTLGDVKSWSISGHSQD